ncbi:hypothetical protein BDP27DRAFT_1511728 [Rhodocollybia butyracea]|uniref:Uncharacterized protein n=1 Tax=Rhodocollybia butyracea TaxID=206335 RepID=A0A9P5P9S7_9AGAR|nr:hypothetical protein BDP27DRAFT_1511728 [Rhodocollybia butyracea]
MADPKKPITSINAPTQTHRQRLRAPIHPGQPAPLRTIQRSYIQPHNGLRTCRVVVFATAMRYPVEKVREKAWRACRVKVGGGEVGGTGGLEGRGEGGHGAGALVKTWSPVNIDQAETGSNGCKMASNGQKWALPKFARYRPNLLILSTRK